MTSSARRQIKGLQPFTVRAIIARDMGSRAWVPLIAAAQGTSETQRIKGLQPFTARAIIARDMGSRASVPLIAAAQGTSETPKGGMAW
jgi:hypothetical protein